MDHLWQARLARIALYLGCGLVLFYLVVPIFAIVPLSFNPEPFFSYNFDEMSLRWYAELVASNAWRLAFTNSLIVAGAVVVLATSLGTLAALGVTLSDFPLKALVVGLLVSPLMVPHIIIGVGAFFFYSWLGIANTLIGLILVHTALATPFVLLTVTATLANFNRNLLRAGQSLGAGPIMVFREIMLPLIWPGILSGAVFAFIASFDELIVAIMLAGSENRTLPRQMWSGVREEISPIITAVATILVALALLLLATMELLRRRAERLGMSGAATSAGA
jgi:putative spermidine/putrescine transport system permease protein